MSEELEWELYDIFESGKFAFPISDHKSARVIVRYLLYRGVLSEEIADAIEDTPIDLEIWLNRHGKYMVGEWVIAWINESRDEYIIEKERDSEYQLESDREGTPTYSIESEGGDQDDSDTELKTLLTIENSDEEDINEALSTVTGKTDTMTDSGDDLDRPPSYTPPPPPLPPRTLQTLKDMTKELIQQRAKNQQRNSEHEHIDDDPEGFYEVPRTGSECLTESTENIYEMTSEHGATSLYSSIPVDVVDETDSVASDQNDKYNFMTLTTQSSPDFNHLSKSGLPICPKCTCKLTHFSLLNFGNHKDIGSVGDRTDDGEDGDDESEGHHHSNDQNDNYCDLYTLSESTLRAMEYAFETLDRDGPGFIFIMTDCIKQCLPWSLNCRYKISSSRQPERCLMEFRSRDIEIELIWQVHVQYHLSAVREVQGILMRYNLHTNWFKCPLSMIVETVATIAKKYKEE